MLLKSLGSTDRLCNPNAYAVIVAYQPERTQLLQLCSILAADGGHVIVVDNSENPYLDTDTFPERCTLITLFSNTGIARAQNVGVETAIAKGAEAIVFFDQDSTVTPGLFNDLTTLLRLGIPDVVSPLCIDDISNSELPSIRLNKLGLPVVTYAGKNQRPIKIDVAISSGTAATKEVFQIAGMFDEKLFIDFVDTEWCLRCRKHGISIQTIPTVRMRHRIGMKSVQIGPFTVQLHNPLRCYYQIRNCFHLFRKQHIPFLFSLRETLSVCFNRLLLLCVVDNRSDYLKAYFSAIRDGLSNISGPKIYNNDCANFQQ